MISLLLSAASSLALLLCFDIACWRNLPMGFEGATVYGGLSLMDGSVLGLLSLFFSVLALRGDGASPGRLIAVVWSGALVASFALVMLVGASGG